MKRKVLSFLLAVLLVLSSISLPTVTPHAQAATFNDLDQNQMVAAMGAGWNLGNQMEACNNGVPSETAWGNPVITQNFINTVANAGFKTIRIPVSYLSKIGPAPNYTIDPAWMARVKQVVDYAMNAGLTAIINLHGDGYNSVSGGWLLPDATDQATIKDKYQKVWSQIATTFASYDQKLVFESMNEVGENATNDSAVLDAYYVNMNAYNQIFVDTVRATGGNNTKRWLMIPGIVTSSEFTLYSSFAIPTDNLCTASGKRIMISVHYYGPFNFAIQNTYDTTQWGSNAPDPNKTCKDGNEAAMESSMKALHDRFVTQGYPVVFGEFGAMDKSYGDPNNEACREYWAKTFCLFARKYGEVPVLWDNGVIGSNQFGFGVFDRPNNTVSNQGLINAIIGSFSAPLPTSAPEPANVTVPIKSLKYYFNVTGVTNETSIEFNATDTYWDQFKIPLSLNGNGSYTLTVPIKQCNERGMIDLGKFTQITNSNIIVNLTKITINGTYDLPFNLNAAVNNQWNGFGTIWSGYTNGQKISTGTNCYMAFNDDPNVSGDEMFSVYIPNTTPTPTPTATPAPTATTAPTAAPTATPAPANSNISSIKYDFNVTGVSSPTTLTFNTMNNDGTWSTVATNLAVNGNGNYSISINPNATGMRNMGYFTTITGSNIVANLSQITVNGSYVLNYSKSLQIGSTSANGLNNIWDGTAAGAQIAQGTSAYLALSSDSSAFLFYTTAPAPTATPTPSPTATPTPTPTVTPTPTPSTLDGIYTIKNVKSNLYLDVSGGSTSNNANIVQNASTGGASQKFKLVSAGNSYYYIYTGVTGYTKVMDVSGKKTTDGTKMIQYQYNGGTNQQYEVKLLSPGVYSILTRNTTSKSAVTVTGGSTSAGATIEQRTNTGATEQQWILTATN